MLGEEDDGNRYSLNEEWSNLLQETMPAKAMNAGSIFVVTGPNSISELPLGADGTVLAVEGSSVEFVTGDFLGETVWPFTSQYQLVYGLTRSDGTAYPSVLGLPRGSGVHYLKSNGAGRFLNWEAR